MIGTKALPKEYGGLEIFESPVGENVWNYFYYWQEEFASNRIFFIGSHIKKKKT